MRKVVLAALAVAAIGVAGIAISRLHLGGSHPVAVVEAAPTLAPTPEPTVLVDVAGAVAQPGVYRLPAGARVIDALLAAGGMTGEADLFALNKAAPVRDGQRLYVPRPGEIAPAGALGSDVQLRIDINRASAAELEALPGIGPSTATKIVRSRNARPFTKIEELQTRGLVTARVFADIRDLISTR